MAVSVTPRVRRTFANSYIHPTTPVAKVRCSIPTDIRSIILDFKTNKSHKGYQELIHIVSEANFEDGELVLFLKEARNNILLFDNTVNHIVGTILKLNWTERSHAVAEEFQGFLIDLLSVHNYYTRSILEELVVLFKADGHAWENNALTGKTRIAFDRVHEVLNILLSIIPMSCNVLKEVIDIHFPYFRKSALEHKSFMFNMFRVLDYRPDVRIDFLFIIVNRLILLDVNVPKNKILKVQEVEEEQFVMEKDDFSNSAEYEVVNTLDQMLDIFYRYLYLTCYNINVSPPALKWIETKNLFEEIFNIFNNVILPTDGIHHVQFIMFYICSFHVTLANAFLNNLWQQVTSPRVASVVRQSAVAYMSSFLARATYISIKVLMEKLYEMVQWIHIYIRNQDGIEYSNSDIKVHSVFYAVCQSVFYIINCRYKELVNSKKGLLFLQSLNLTKIVTCGCNPLKVCLPSVVQNFAAITRNYQLAYCYTIIEHNSRTRLPVVHINEQGITFVSPQNEILNDFFPFDPYVLKKSSSVISNIYRDAHPSVEDQSPVKPICDEEDDFLSQYAADTSTIPILGLSPC